MSSVEAFSSLLYELIAMNKLSGSRVARVTESATHALHDPDGLSKVMLKAHMRAPPQNKLVSLYLFDAIARHAQDIARRNGTVQVCRRLSHPLSWLLMLLPFYTCCKSQRLK